MFKDPLSTLRLVWLISLFLSACLALPSLMAGLWFESVAKFLLVMSLMLLGLKAVLYFLSDKNTDKEAEAEKN
jgi:hypothetical protein